MLTFLKWATLAGNAAGVCALLALPVEAMASGSTGNDDIVVKSASAMQQWQKQTTVKLNRALQRAEPMRTNPEPAIVQISFKRGTDGRPEDIRFYNDEGGWLERMIAKRAVKSLDNLDQVPAVSAGEVHFLANIIFADDERDHDRLRKRLETMERARLASADPGRTLLALGY
jgi:hypothetical protein